MFLWCRGRPGRQGLKNLACYGKACTVSGNQGASHPGGFGGIGGEYVKPTALANVRALKQRLNPSIEIIGTGGILTGRDAYEHLLCGASMLQVGTQLEKEGLGVFDRLTKELLAILESKGYASIAEFKGKLGTLD